MAARGQSLLAIAPKVTKNASPCTPLLPPVLATGGMRQRHTKASLTLRTACARGRIYDRPLPRSSARAEGAFQEACTVLPCIRQNSYLELLRNDEESHDQITSILSVTGVDQNCARKNSNGCDA